MRKIEQTSAFKRDFKRIAKSHYRKNLQADFKDVLEALVNDNVLAEKYHDHALTGEWKDFRDCHIKPDLVLIYRKPDETILQLVRLGSYSELGL